VLRSAGFGLARPADEWLGCVAVGAPKVTVDQRMGKLLLPTHELESIRLELVAARVALVQRLPLCDERADRFL
jgi:hypothetical protein